MKFDCTKLVSATSLVCLGWLELAFAQPSGKEADPPRLEPAIELSPFVVDEKPGQGYYASQTLAGGRLRQDIKDIGSSIQVVTKELMDDLGVTGVEELFQYTTSTEVGGILGNFTGSNDASARGDANIDDARRDPDGTTRIRGLAAPDRARDFFKTDIPFDSYNTDRVDINRGANSFLFGLGSPAGLTNQGLIKARFRDTNEVSTRIASGGKNPSYRGSFNLNRVLIKDTLAIHGAVLLDRTQYRQQPTYKDDARQYGAVAYRPFKNQDTVITAHVENGRIRGNAPGVLLPKQNLDTFFDYAPVARLSIDPYANLQRFGNVNGPTQVQWNALSAAEKLKFRVRDTVTPTSMGNANWGNGSYGLVYDGSTGARPAFAYTAQYRANDYAVGDPFFNPTRVARAAPFNTYPNNRSQINGVGWLVQGFTDLKTFDFSKQNLGWANDYYTRDFVNYNVGLTQVLWDGRAGFDVAYDYQDLFKRDFTAFEIGTARIYFDMNETLFLPSDPNYRTSGVVAAMPNPNYGRPFVITEATPRTYDTQREAARFTGFIKFDFAEKTKARQWLGKLLGRHTLTGLADKSTFDEKQISYSLSSFGDPEPALHIGPPNARLANGNARRVQLMSYIGPAQLDAFTNPNFKLGDFVLTPAKYQLGLPADYSIQKLSWNLGPDVTAANLGQASVVNGNEGFVLGTFTPRYVPSSNYRLQQTKVTSFAVNGQSFFWDRLLVVNTGYRQDTVKTWLNTQAPLLGPDEIPDVSPEGFSLENGSFLKIKSSVFGYGGVLNWPSQLIKLPWGGNLALHYNTSENFVPATDRVDQFHRPLSSPSGRSKDYGVSVFLWDNKVVARFNWYNSRLAGATSNVSQLFNQMFGNIFQHHGFLNADILRVDANNDGAIDDAVKNQIAVNAATGLTPDGLTRDQAAARFYPNLTKARAARASMESYLTDELKTAYNFKVLADGSNTILGDPRGVSDTNDIEAKGFEAELTFNPTPNWRIAFNAARQETILTDIAPGLTDVIEKTWLPHLTQYGDLDWDLPVGPVNGVTINQQVAVRFVDYFAVKGQEGRPQIEQRKWRLNMVTRYSFSEGRLKGFSIGGALRWEDRFANGYPIYTDPNGVVLPDISKPYFSEATTSCDLMFGYRRRIMGNKDWTAQLNARNLQNWSGDRVSVISRQPDGSIARVRFDPALEILLTNTFRF
ncbi:MAG: TonB-dependent receptor plug domain-containing protein [Opitutaceae bacterium]|nr:TonB-dependent receptor plug domain-containing protein [Opitutaceae bacterium]